MPALPNDQRFAELTIGIGAALASIAFSVIHLAFDPLPNPDGVVYLLAAQAWLDEGYAAAAAIYPLPVYSILIASVNSATGLTLLTSAHCLDAAFIAGLIVAMQRLTVVLGGGVRVQAIVVTLALLLPELNGYRSFLLRDFGYWMFVTFALVFLARHAVVPAWTHATAFVLMCALAAAFRAEAILLMAAAPLGLLSHHAGKRSLGMVSISVLTAVVALAVLYVALWESPSTTWLSQALHNGISLAADVPARLHTQVEGFGTRVLDPRFDDYAAFGVIGGLTTMIAVHVVNAASLPLAAIAVIGLLMGFRRQMERRATPIVFVALGVAILALAVVLAARGIIQTRYAMSAGLLIVVIAAFVIDDWYARAEARRSRLNWASALLAAYLLGEAAFGLLTSKQHYVDAADWLAQHTAPGVRIFSNDMRVVYLAGRTVDWRDTDVVISSEANRHKPYDFWVTNAARDGADRFVAAGELTEVARFANEKGQTLLIYSASSPTTASGRAP